MVFDGLPARAKLTLERVHRQADDNPILDLAHALGDEALEFEDFERMVEAAARRDGRVRVEGRVDAGLMARSPVLCWRNATRVRLIQAFRTAHGAPADALLPGEPLICDGIELPVKHRKKRIDLEARTVSLHGRAVSLTPTEYSLLKYLATNAGKVLTHPMILRAVWGAAYEDTAVLRTYVNQLRAKLEDDPAEPRFIRTEPRVGYRFLIPET